MTYERGRDPTPTQAGSSQPAPASAPELPEPPKVSRARVLGVLLVLLACIVAAFFAGYLPRRAADQRLEQGAQPAQSQIPRVPIVRPESRVGDLNVVLPGSIQPLHETTLYPQADGYVGRFLVDIGDQVEAEQALAEIETPALDQELQQARAALAQVEASLGQAKANRDYAQTTLQRYTALLPAGVTSQQELDQRRAEALVGQANVTAAQAAVAAQAANIRRLAQLKRFAKVVAPFAGTITARFIDRGTLVTSGSSTPLFRLVVTDPVRVFVQVPQDVAPSVQVGATATLGLREYRGRTFTGVIRRTAGALDTATRTLNTEVRVPNPDNELLAGMYTTVTLTLKAPRVIFELPETALYFDAHGLRVATVDREDKIHFVPITLDRDLGPTLLVSAGLRGDERVARLANALLREGMRVSVQP